MTHQDRMKMILDQVINDYKYLNSIRDDIEKNLDNYTVPISFDPNLLSVVDGYDSNELEYYTIIINDYIERINHGNEKYLINSLQENKMDMLNVIGDCLLMLASDMDRIRAKINKDEEHE